MPEAGRRVDVGRRNLYVVFISNLVAATGMAGFLPAFPIILPMRFGVTDPGAIALWTGALTAAAPFSAALAGPLWGAIGDRIGRKLMVLRALYGLVVFTGAMAFVSDPWILLALRLGQGVFSGFIAPSLTFVSVHSHPSKQGSVAASLQVALLAGGVLGPPLGGQILDHGSPSMLFGMASSGALLAALLVGFYAREEIRPEISPLRKPSPVWHDVRETLADAGVRRLLLAIFAVRFGTASVEPLFATYSETFKGTSTFVRENFGLANGALCSAAALGNLIALPAWGRRGDRYGYRRTLAVAAAGAGIFYAPQAFAPDPWSLFGIRVCAGLFLAGVIPAAYGMMAEETPIERRGSSYSLTFSAVALANSLAPLVGGVLAGPVGIRRLLVLAAVPILGSAIWIGRWPRRTEVNPASGR